jgi:Flp pilus assembly protein TadG
MANCWIKQENNIVINPKFANKFSIPSNLMHKIASLKNEQGSTLVEFTAVLLILLALTFGMIDFGRYVYAISAVRSAAQEGARAALIPDSDIAVAQAAAESKMVALDIARTTVNIVRGAEIVDSEVTYTFEFITPLLAAAMSQPTVEITGTASMAIY